MIIQPNKDSAPGSRSCQARSGGSGTNSRTCGKPLSDKLYADRMWRPWCRCSSFHKMVRSGQSQPLSNGASHCNGVLLSRVPPFSPYGLCCGGLPGLHPRGCCCRQWLRRYMGGHPHGHVSCSHSPALPEWSRRTLPRPRHS